MDALSAQMNGARTIVTKTRAGTLFEIICDNPAAQRSEQIGVRIIHAIHNHWPPPDPPPCFVKESANNNARSAGAKNSSNKIVPPHAWVALDPSASAT